MYFGLPNKKLKQSLLSFTKEITRTLCFLDLSAAFHSILNERLSSWFGQNGTVLSWVQSYLTFR